ncbi:carbohydrate kinase family protein [Pedobacter sp.]|nr:carbohydrate kinase family protein [Candidatus Saccharibacteria bacterium]
MTHQTQTPSILSIGKATQDVFLKSDEFDPHIEGKVAFTHLPLGAKLDVEDVHFATGGNATNVAVTFARQGLRASYLWALGTDSASQVVIAELDQENVDTSLVVQDEKFRAGYSCVLLANSGERTILNYHGTMPRFNDRALQLDAVANFDWVYPTSLGSMEMLESIVTKARSGGAKVMLNPAGNELADPARLKAILPDIDVLCLNKEEMQLLVEGQTSEELVRHGMNLCDVVIVSDGPNGVVASDGKTIVTAGMYEDVPVVDRTGAGDAFGSGFLSQWAQGKTLEESILFASANSTSVVGLIGAKPGILHLGTQLHDMPLTSKLF